MLIRCFLLQNIRPTIPERWICNETLFSVSNIMQESWNAKPSSRLSHLRVKKAFAKLIDNTVDIKRGWKENLKTMIECNIFRQSPQNQFLSVRVNYYFRSWKKYYLRFFVNNNLFLYNFFCTVQQLSTVILEKIWAVINSPAAFDQQL